MKKILLSSLALLSVLTSCSYSQRIENNDKRASQKYTAPFKFIKSGFDYDLVYDTETNVEYVVSSNDAGGYGNGIFVMLVDSAGKPKLYNK